MDLTGLATDARPVVRALGAAAPQVRALLGDLDPLAHAARPTLVKLSQLSATGRRAVRASMPVARLLDPVARRLRPTVRIARPLVDSLRDKRVIEALGPYVFYGAIASARFDKVSHILPSYQITGACQQYAEHPAAGCSAHFAAMGKGGAAQSARRADRSVPGVTETAPGRVGRRRGGRRHGRRAPLGIAQRAARAAGALPRRPGRPGLPSQLLDWLLQP